MTKRKSVRKKQAEWKRMINRQNVDDRKVSISTEMINSKVPFTEIGVADI